MQAEIRSVASVPPPLSEERRAKRKIYDREWWAKNSERMKARRIQNAAHHKALRAAQYAAHREENVAKTRAYRDVNPERVKAQRAAHQIKHKARLNAASRARYHANKESARWDFMGRRYGITETAFVALRAAQCGLCAICREPLVPGRKTHVDHDHATKKIRGLLCHHCNTGLGLFREDAERLTAAAKYVAECK